MFSITISDDYTQNFHIAWVIIWLPLFLLDIYARCHLILLQRRIICSTIFFAFFLKCSSALSIQYLRRVNRFQNSSTVDNYYSCNGEGSTLQWLVNNVSVGGYSSQDVGRVINTAVDGFNITSTLLSASTVTLTNTVIFVSILIVSARNATYLEVGCTNNIDINRIRNINPPKYDKTSNKLTFSSNKDIIIDYVVSERIQLNIPRRTYIVMCGSNSLELGLLTDEKTIGYSSDDRVGRIRNVFNFNKPEVNFQGILMSRESFGIIVVAFITELSDFNITCASGNNMVRIQLKNQPYFMPILPSLTISIKSTEFKSLVQPSTSIITNSLFGK